MLLQQQYYSLALTIGDAIAIIGTAGIVFGGINAWFYYRFKAMIAEELSEVHQLIQKHAKESSHQLQEIVDKLVSKEQLPGLLAIFKQDFVEQINGPEGYVGKREFNIISKSFTADNTNLWKEVSRIRDRLYNLPPES